MCGNINYTVKLFTIGFVLDSGYSSEMIKNSHVDSVINGAFSILTKKHMVMYLY